MKRLILLTCLLMLIAFVSTCKKDPDLPGVSNRIEFGDSTIDTLSYREISITTVITSIGDDAITQHGHCWSTEAIPTTSGSHDFLGSMPAAGSFKSQIKDLNPNTYYYIRPYITKKEGTYYGTEIQVKTQ
jgi:hypothetical protein